MEPFILGKLVVEHYDQNGLPFDLTLPILNEQNKPVALLGILTESAKRKWSPKLLGLVVSEWLKNNKPSEIETKAIDHLVNTGIL